jgi:Tfp pilus assembly protein PilE
MGVPLATDGLIASLAISAKRHGLWPALSGAVYHWEIALHQNWIQYCVPMTEHSPMWRRSQGPIRPNRQIGPITISRTSLSERKRPHNRGFTLLDVMMSLAVTALVMGVLMQGLSTKANSRRTVDELLAKDLGTSILERILPGQNRVLQTISDDNTGWEVSVGASQHSAFTTYSATASKQGNEIATRHRPIAND